MAVPAPDFRKRLAGIQRRLLPHQAVLLSKPTDIFYYTGFPQLAPAEREAFLLLTPDEAVLFHHSFSPAPPARSGIQSIPKASLAAMKPFLPKKTDADIQIDEHNLTVAEHAQLADIVTGTLSPFHPEKIWQHRMYKDAHEQAVMKTAGALTHKTWVRVSEQITAGMTERELATLITTTLIQEGAPEPAFPIIVAFGENSALPHHQPTSRKLTAEMPVLLDFGARFGGYCADMTRTFWFGDTPSEQFAQVETIVKTAYDAVLNALNQRGDATTAQELDSLARMAITQEGFGDQFIHTTGHGLGIEIHEPPSLSWNVSTPIRPDMVVTVEPGIYLPGEFGYRHENTVLITKKGTAILTA